MDEKKMKRMAARFARLKNEDKAKRVIGRLKTQDELLVFALVCPCEAVAEAVHRITDKYLLYTIAVQARNMTARIEVVKESNDKELLKAIYAYKDNQEYIMYNTQSWAHSRIHELEEQEVAIIDDEERLIQMILGKEPSPAFDKIIKKITSFDRIIRVIRESPVFYIRNEAFRRILPNKFDQTLYTGAPGQEEALAELMIQEEDTQIDVLYPHYLTDQKLLLRLIHEAKRLDLRVAALYSLEHPDEALLRELAVNEGFSKMQDAVIVKTKNPLLLHSFVMDTQLSFDFRKDCLVKMFKEASFECYSELPALRVQGVESLIQTARRPGGYDKEQICSVCRSIPKQFHEKYGFTTEEWSYEDEDGYGRYTSSHLKIMYGGNSYLAY